MSSARSMANTGKDTPHTAMSAISDEDNVRWLEFADAVWLISTGCGIIGLGAVEAEKSNVMGLTASCFKSEDGSFGPSLVPIPLAAVDTGVEQLGPVKPNWHSQAYDACLVLHLHLPPNFVYFRSFNISFEFLSLIKSASEFENSLTYKIT